MRHLDGDARRSGRARRFCNRRRRHATARSLRGSPPAATTGRRIWGSRSSAARPVQPPAPQAECGVIGDRTGARSAPPHRDAAQHPAAQSGRIGQHDRQAGAPRHPRQQREPEYAPSRWPMTITGLSSMVTVHLPSSAWKITTASVSAATFAKSRPDLAREPAPDLIRGGSTSATPRTTGSPRPAPRPAAPAGCVPACTAGSRTPPAPMRRAPARCRVCACAPPARPAAAPARRGPRRGDDAPVRARPCGVPHRISVADGADLPSLAGPRSTAIAGRPVGTAQAGVGQAHEGAEHDHAQRRRDRQPRRCDGSVW